MTKEEKFLATLNEEELELVRNKKVAPTPFDFLWYYKVFSEYEDTKKAMQMQHRKAELYDKWKALGLIEE